MNARYSDRSIACISQTGKEGSRHKQASSTPPAEQANDAPALQEPIMKTRETMALLCPTPTRYEMYATPQVVLWMHILARLASASTSYTFGNVQGTYDYGLPNMDSQIFTSLESRSIIQDRANWESFANETRAPKFAFSAKIYRKARRLLPWFAQLA